MNFLEGLKMSDSRSGSEEVRQEQAQEREAQS
jgi:hypothetical protein